MGYLTKRHLEGAHPTLLYRDHIMGAVRVVAIISCCIKDSVKLGLDC